LLTGNDGLGRVFVWDIGTRSQALGPLVSLPTGTELESVTIGNGLVRDVIFSSPETIVAISADAVVTWDLSVAPGLSRGSEVSAPEGVVDLDVGDDGTISLVTSNGLVRPSPLWTADRFATAVLFSAQGLAVGNQDGQVDENGTRLAVLDFPIVDLAGSVDGGVIVAATEDGVELIRPDRIRLVEAQGATAIAVAPDGSAVAIATGTEPEAIRLWTVGETIVEERPIDSGHTLSIDALAITPDGDVISGSDDRTVRITPADGTSNPVVLQGHTDGVSSLAVVGDEIWSASQDGFVIRWAPSNGRFRRVGQPIAVAAGSVQIAYGGSALWVASRSEVYRWAVSGDEMIQSACAWASRPLTEAELLVYELEAQSGC
jgi:WD40 repeat protein